MAIVGDNASPEPQKAAPKPRPPHTEGAWGFHDGGFFQSPIPRGIGSEDYNKLKEHIIEAYKNANKNFEMTVLDLSRATDTALDFSCLLVCSRLRDLKSLGVAVHVVLLASTGGEIPVLSERTYDRTVSVYRVPSDAINTILVDKAVRLVMTQFNLSRPNEVIFVDGVVVPTTFDINNRDSIQQLALNSAFAGINELNSRRPGSFDLNLARLTDTGVSQIDVSFQHQQLKDIVSNVYRSDILITFSNRRDGDNQDRMLNTGDRNAVFSEISSFADVVWCPAADQSQFATVFAPQQAGLTQKFVPRQVISQVRPEYAQTTGATLLAISTALALRNPSVWIQAFRPVVSNRREQDLRDIGFLNIEGNIPVLQANGLLAPDPSGHGKVIDTKADDFRVEQLGLYVAALFHKDIMIAIDVPEYGPSTHYLNIFAAANRGVSGAIDRIYAAANELTNGEFSKHFPRGTPIFATGSERIHAGTWVDKEGLVRDIRDFDYIAVASLAGQRDPKMIRDWSDTFLRLEFPEIQRLEARRKMISSLSGETAKFTGYYQRLTFSRSFLESLDKAIAAMQLRVNIRTPLNGNEFYNQRGVASYAQMATLGFGPSYIQQGGYAGAPSPTMVYSQYRW